MKFAGMEKGRDRLGKIQSLQSLKKEVVNRERRI